ncbi:hypothetical protein [Klebsiella pneumoniae IS39]|nr:hypothetical protein [Klebsiella pneumoniae IS39]
MPGLWGIGKIIITISDFSILFIIKINRVAFCFDNKVLHLNFLSEMIFYLRGGCI